MASSAGKVLFNMFQSPVASKDVRRDTPEPVCRYRLLKYETIYQFVAK